MVSSTLIALAFVGQISSLGLAFQVFTLILLPTALFLGVATFGRVLESSIDDYFYLGGINRIHHFYAEVVPEVRTYFVLSPYDDWRGRMRSMGVAPSRCRSLSPATAVVGVINSIIAGALMGVLASWLLLWTISLCALGGVVGLGLERRRAHSFLPPLS